jgi:hypothetical protein
MKSGKAHFPTPTTKREAMGILWDEKKALRLT